MLATGQRGQNSDVVVWDTKQLAQKFRCVLVRSADDSSNDLQHVGSLQ